MLNECPAIKYVKLYNPVPVDISAEQYMFGSTFMLYVPVGTKDAYVKSGCWGLAQNITEFDTIYSKTINLNAGNL